MPPSIERSLSKARSFARRGDVVAARALYDEVLTHYPNNERAKKARAGLADPSLTEDGSAKARKALSHVQALQKAGQLAEAESAAWRLVQTHPSAKAYFLLGTILIAQGSVREAAEAFSQAIQLQPTFALAYNNLGNAWFKLGDHKNAVLAYNEALQHDDKLASAYSNLGAAFVEMKRYDAALRCLNVAIELDPGIAQALNNRGLALRELGHSEEALASFGRALQLTPKATEVIVNLAATLRLMDRHVEAITHLKKVLDLKPDLAEGYNNLGAVHGDLGDFAAAKASYQKAIEVRPTFAHAHYNLSALKRYKVDDPHLLQMRRLLERDLDEDERLHLNFALGKAADDYGDVDEAFARFAEGNRLRKQLRPYDREAAVRTLAAIRRYFDSDIKPLAIEEGVRRRPIFIVGMPRSGTTLVEQILASHSAVHGGGEMPHMRRAAAEGLKEPSTLDEARLATVRTAYLDAIDTLGSGQPVVTDKMPANFHWVGLIATALPEAAIIDVRRDPRATCWSIFRQFFSADGNGYAYDQEDVAHYYGQYLEMMAYWHSRFPGRVHTLNYERLTEDQENETRQLLDRCDLTFEEACLAFHKSKRVVTTASASQVRRGLYKGSSESWRAYEAHLGPMLEMLARVGAI